MSRTDFKFSVPELFRNQAAITFVVIPTRRNVHQGVLNMWHAHARQGGSEVWQFDATSANFERQKAAKESYAAIDASALTDVVANERFSAALGAIRGTSCVLRLETGDVHVEQLAGETNISHVLNVMSDNWNTHVLVQPVPDTTEPTCADVYRIHSSLSAELLYKGPPNRAERPFAYSNTELSPLTISVRAYRRFTAPQAVVLVLHAGITMRSTNPIGKEVDLMKYLAYLLRETRTDDAAGDENLMTHDKLAHWRIVCDEGVYLSGELRLCSIVGPASERGVFHRWLLKQMTRWPNGLPPDDSFRKFLRVISYTPPVERDLSMVFFSMMRLHFRANPTLSKHG